MAMPPLSHHDIIKISAPMTRAGFKVNLTRCDRKQHYIEFEASTNSAEKSTTVYCLESDEDQKSHLVRVVVHESGLVSTLRASYSDLEHTLKCLATIATSRQLIVNDNFIIANSFVLTSTKPVDETEHALRLNFTCAQVAGMELRADISASGGMPADVRLLASGIASPNLREHLADETILPLDHRAALALRQQSMSSVINDKLSNLPEDLLAILGSQWRPLRFQGDHWKTLLRQLGTGARRSELAEKHVVEAIQHLYETAKRGPAKYHTDFHKARWQVYFRRLQPLMMLFAMLSIMPIAWLLVSTGTIGINPLALSITPLLMVGAIVLTAREVPVMEIPPTPRALTNKPWGTSSADINNHDASSNELPVKKV